jgi:hypothetical protein
MLRESQNSIIIVCIKGAGRALATQKRKKTMQVIVFHSKLIKKGEV